MSKIKHNFTPIPNYFFKNGWFNDQKMTQLIVWCFSKCRLEKHKEFYDFKEVELEPFEFICGNEKFFQEIGLTRNEVRNRLNSLQMAGILKKTTNSITNRFTCYIWVTETFCENDHQPKNQPAANRQPTGSQPLYNTVLEERTKKKETTPPTSSFKKSQKPESEKSVVVVSSIIEELDIGLTQVQKIELSKLPIEHVQKCIDYIKHPSFKVKKSPIDALFWAVNQKVPPVHTNTPASENNRVIDEINKYLIDLGYAHIVKENKDIENQGIMKIPESINGKIHFEQVSLKSDQFQNDLKNAKTLLCNQITKRSKQLL